MNDILIKQDSEAFEAVEVGHRQYVLVDHRGALMCPCCVEIGSLVSVLGDATIVWPEWGGATHWHRMWEGVPVVFAGKVCDEHPYAACKGKEAWRTLFRERLASQG